MKKIIKLALFAFTCVFFTACPRNVDPESSSTYEEETITYKNERNVVRNKYSKPSTSSSQNEWKALNCHDPKLFQDDDGTYYVYSTDASIGNEEHTGIVVRSSKDLLNWTCHDHSALYGFWDKDFLAWEGFSAYSKEVVHNTDGTTGGTHTAYTWAPTVIKLNDLYYMYHGVNADVPSSAGGTFAASSIVLAIASSAKGPFYPANEISNFNRSTETRENYLSLADDIESIQSKLKSLGVTYKQNFLVRHTRAGNNTSSVRYLDDVKLDEPDYKLSLNGRFGCIDPEFVFDVATGNLMEYTIGTNECYGLIYGSWMHGIAICYVDKVSLKPVYWSANSALANKTITSLAGDSYSLGDELDIPLDEANYYAYGSSSYGNTGNEGALGARISGGYGGSNEGAQLIYNSETSYYYLFVSMGDLSYEYRVGLGRSKNTCSKTDLVPTEYFDAGGQTMTLTRDTSGSYHAISSKIIGATELLGEWSWRCPGGQSILRTSNGKIIFSCHSRSNFQPGYYFWLQCRQMLFNEDGWPILNGNEYFNDFEDFTYLDSVGGTEVKLSTADGGESLSAITMEQIAGTYDTILTVRGTGTSIPSVYGETLSKEFNTLDAAPTASKSLTIDSLGNISGSYSGTLSLASDGYSATINLKDAEGNELGTFRGYFMWAVDWALKGLTDSKRYTITFTTLDSTTGDAEAGEYFWGNRRNGYTTKSE